MSLGVPTIACALVALLGSLSGCGTSAVQVQLGELREEVTNLRSEIRAMRGEMNDSMSLALCSPELRQLLEDVQKECTPLGDAPHGGGQCSTRQIRPAVIAADPEHRGRFLKLMSHLPHEVVYITKDAKEVAAYRHDRLVKLARRAILANTVFLVVVSPEDGEDEAQRRAVMVESMLRETQIDKKRVRRWVYQYPASKGDIERMQDMPGLGETRELFRGVWVFRADC